MRIPQRVLDIALPPFDPLNLRAAELRKQGLDVISLGQALPYFPPPPSVNRAARDALSSPQVHAYSTDPGRPSLRRALAERLHDETGADCGPENLVITAGGNHAFATAIATLVDPGDDVVLPAPYFTNHYMQVQASGAIAVEAPLADQQTYDVTWDDVARALTPRTRAVVLCNPSNPTGATLTRANGERIVRELASRNMWVISDETYMHFVYDDPHWSAASVSDWHRNVVVIGTFSKSFAMMGWRVGFMMAGGDVCEQATKIQDAMIICAPTISQMAAEAAVNEDWNYARRFHPEFRRRRQRVAERLADIPELEWSPTAGGFFAFVRVAGCSDSNALATRFLEEAHIVTIPGAAFGRSGEGCLRMSYGSANAADLETALQRLTEYFAKVRQ